MSHSPSNHILMKSPPPLDQGWPCVTNRIWQRNTQWLLRLSLKGFASSILVRWLIHPRENQLPCHNDTQAVPWRKTVAAANSQHHLARHMVTPAPVDPSASVDPAGDRSPSQHLMETSWETPKTVELSYSPIPIPNRPTETMRGNSMIVVVFNY